MFQYKNSLKQFDEEKYPYSLEFVKEGYYDSLHGECTKDGFNIMTGGSKHLFCTPRLSAFTFKVNITCSHYRAPYRPLVFALLMGYDKVTQNGYEIECKYEYGIRQFSISLVALAGLQKTVLQEKIFKNVDLKYNTRTPFRIIAENGKVIGCFGTFAFEFNFSCPKGRLGIDVSHVSIGVLFADAQITSKETVEKKQLFKRHFILPKRNGGVLPYEMEITAYVVSDGVYEMKYRLMGGTSAIPHRNIHSNVWLLSYDDITDLYIKVIHKGQAKKYYLFNGTKRFCDPNMREVYLNFFKQVFDMKQTPLTGSFYIMSFPEDVLLSIGYEHFYALPYAAMEGSSEYIFNRECQLIYSGEPLEKEMIASFVSYDKKIVKKLPKTLWHYEDAVQHAERNHYFYTDEEPKFKIMMFSKLDFDHVTVRISLQDAYLTKIKEFWAELPQIEDFSLLNYQSAVSFFNLPKLKCGVYHIQADMLLHGQVVIATHSAALEVMDEKSEISPQQASRLPYMHLGDGGSNLVYTGAPDFYTEMPECDFGHYFTNALYPTITAEEMHVWEILKFYKREFFIWPTKRTIKDYDLSKLKGVMTNADHIFPELPGFEDLPSSAPYRYDSFRFGPYGKSLKTWLNAFLEEHPDYKDTLGIPDALAAFTPKDHIALLKLCGYEWVDYILPKIKQLILKQTAELKKSNPSFKRTGYGPWSTYFVPYSGGYAARWFGYDLETLHEIYDGYMQLEDYPYSCAYRTTRSAWAMMTTKLCNHSLKIHPELYFDFPSACPDPAVICAYPPLGDSKCPYYFTMTQMYEYVYSSAYFDKGEFDYWRDYGFAPLQIINDIKGRMRQILPAWKQVLENKPVRPVKTVAFVYDINHEEDRFDLDIKANIVYNISESNLGYLYDLMKANGIPSGFGLKFKDIICLTEEDVSCIVLPDMTKASVEVIDKLRMLHEKGVTLIAVSKTGALSNLFGATENKRKVSVNCIRTVDDDENVYPSRVEFFHDNTDGEVLLAAESGEPIIIKNANTILLNTAISQVGIDHISTIDFCGRPNISRLLKEVLLDAVRATVTRLAESDKGTGITITKTENGDTLLILIDYAKYDQANRETPARHEIRFCTDEWKDIAYVNVCNDHVGLIKHFAGDVLKGISVMLRPHETLLFKLKK